MEKRLFIAADDLTGALDTGVQFAARGLSVRVTRLPYIPGSPCDVEVVCTDTRHLPPAQAQSILTALFTAANGHFARYMKKLDSTLRGNVGSELLGMVRALGVGTVHLLNAFPAAGRTTQGGLQYVNGVRLDQTPFAKDPFNPIADASIRSIVLSQAPELDHRLCIYDAQTDEDIDRQLACDAALRGARMLAGCAGLADGLARRWAKPRCAAQRVHGCLLILCGSLSPVSAAQMDAARAQGMRIETLPESFMYAEADACAAQADRIMSRLAREPMIIRTPAPESSAAPLEGGSIAAAMGRLFAALVRAGLRQPVMIIGGDTLGACMQEAGVRTLIPLGQPLPGTALLAMDNLPFPLLSKAGGFGKEDTLIQLILRTKGGFTC